MIQLSDHFTYKHLMRFTLPSITMMIFTSVYGVVDGFFVSNFTGKTEFAAVNFVYPLLMILGCVGFMFGTGGGALIAITLGTGNRKRANEIFSLLVYTAMVCGVVLAAVGMVLLKPVMVLMGAEKEMLDACVFYGRIILCALPFFVLQYEFQCLFATAEKPKLGLYVTAAAGVTNMALDGLFVAVFSWGLAGAAAATALSQFVGGIIPLIYFGRRNTSLLRLAKFRLAKCRFEGSVLAKACANGASELMSSVSMSIVSMLYNVQLMKYVGEDGVAAYGVLMYVSMIFQAVFIGYSVGTSPVVGYHYGAQNQEELKSLLRKSACVTVVFSILMCLAGEFLGMPLSVLFVGYDEGLLEMTAHAFAIFSFSFLFSGIAILGSGFFTALGDGLTSALISFLRTLVFQIAAVLIFPVLWGLDGIWFSIVFAEIMAVAVTLVFLYAKRRRYRYI